MNVKFLSVAAVVICMQSAILVDLMLERRADETRHDELKRGVITLYENQGALGRICRPGVNL